MTVTMHLCCPLLVSNVTIHYISLCVFDITVSRAALTLASIMALSVWLLLGGGWRSSDSDNASVLPFNREDSCRERGRTKPHVQCQASI